MMRVCFILFFGMYLMGCAKPIQMEIPKNHPANPHASAAPETGQSDYLYHLPNPTEIEREPGLAGTENAATRQHKADKKTGHEGHGSMSPKKPEGDHDH